jgi:hypothetical protein
MEFNLIASAIDFGSYAGKSGPRASCISVERLLEYLRWVETNEVCFRESINQQALERTASFPRTLASAVESFKGAPLVVQK